MIHTLTINNRSLGFWSFVSQLNLVWLSSHKNPKQLDKRTYIEESEMKTMSVQVVLKIKAEKACEMGPGSLRLFKLGPGNSFQQPLCA